MSAIAAVAPRRPLGTRSIRFKLVAVMLGVAALTLALAGAGILVYARTSFDRQMAQQLQTLADVIALNSTGALAFGDAKVATETLSALRGDAQVRAAALYLAEGRLFASYAREPGTVEVPDRLDLLPYYEHAGDRVVLTDLVMLKDRPLGALYLVADTTQWDEIWHGYTGILVALFLAVLTVGLLLSVWLQRLFSRPVLDLAGLMHRIGRERDYTLRAGKFADDEIGALVDGFNDMVAQIERRRLEVEQARAELESRIVELNVEMAERERAEQALRRSEERERAHAAELQSVMEAVPAVVFVARDPECQIVTANRAGYELLGLPPGSNVSRTPSPGAAPPPFRVLHDGRELPSGELPVQRAARTGSEIRNFELEVALPGGKRHVLLGSAVPLLGPDRRPRGAVAVFVDIAERKRAEEALRASEERYRTLVSATTSVVWTTDPAGRFVEPQPGWQAYTGQTWDEYRGLGWQEALHADDRERVLAAWKRAVETGEGYESETRLWHAPSGRYRYVAARAAALRDQAGGIREWIGTFSDIDDRKRAEEQFRLAVEAAPNAMVMIDQDGRILLANRELEALFGYEREEVIGQPVELLVPERSRALHPDQRRGFFADPRARTMGAGRELYGRRKDGRQVPVEIGLNPIVTNEGVLCLASIIDITERKRAEQEFRRYTEELKRSNRELAQFAYVASHDLQEPLRAISGCVQLLQQRYRGKLDQRADELIEHAVSGAVRMQTLINDLLAYSRVDSRARPFERCDLGQPLAQALANLQLAIAESGATVTSDDMPVITGDPVQITQLLQNLIGNAIKFRGDQPPRVHVGVDRKGERVLFYVRDNGIGIEPQYFERIFGVFQRLHTRTHYPGTGIGLAICRKIVERHHGRIWVESAGGKGSTFYFTLQAGSAQDEQPGQYRHGG
ncbi:PAS domain S-box protein [Sulfurifustis variabilis]|uniref:PAS domain S-box protein n=1 Tax=Sulfurifustis variabilis TaxID=1675686 RepID=UPI000BBACF28|nr:PAS domain S-box protein [Sulfurifustis variabilis]